MSILKLIFVTPFVLGLISCSEDPSLFPFNSHDFKKTNSDIGCDSKLNGNQKDDLWAQKYKNHWMTWTGAVMFADPKETALQIDGVGRQDLEIIFGDGHSGYDLEKGELATIKFVMKSLSLIHI